MSTRRGHQLDLPLPGTQIELQLSGRWVLPSRRVSLASPRGAQLRRWLSAVRRPLHQKYCGLRMFGSSAPTLRWLGSVSLRLAALLDAVGLGALCLYEARWGAALLAEAARRPGGRRRRGLPS